MGEVRIATVRVLARVLRSGRLAQRVVPRSAVLGPMYAVVVLELAWLVPAAMAGSGFVVPVLYALAAVGCLELYRAAHEGRVASDGFAYQADSLLLVAWIVLTVLQVVVAPFDPRVPAVPTVLVSLQTLLWLVASSLAWCTYPSVGDRSAAAPRAPAGG